MDFEFHRAQYENRQRATQQPQVDDDDNPHRGCSSDPCAAYQSPAEEPCAIWLGPICTAEMGKSWAGVWGAMGAPSPIASQLDCAVLSLLAVRLARGPRPGPGCWGQ